MAAFIRSAVYAAFSALSQQGLPVKRSLIYEVMAASLGYRTYAALTAEEGDPKLEYHLEDAEFLILNQPLGERRAVELKLPTPVAMACLMALKQCVSRAQVYVGTPDFYYCWAREALAETIYDADDVADAMAESNAMFSNEPAMPIECPPTVDIWTAVDEWRLEVNGDIKGLYDPDGDRMYNGHVLNCRGTLTFVKAGRAGLVLTDSKGHGGADDSWRDEEFLGEPGNDLSVSPQE